MLSEGSQCYQQGLDWWHWRLRSRASTLCHFTWYLGSARDSGAGKYHVHCLLRYSLPPLLPSFIAFLCGTLEDALDALFSEQEIRKGGIQSHEIRGPRWEQEVKGKGRGPHLWVNTHELTTASSRLSPGRHQARAIQSPALLWHGPS